MSKETFPRSLGHIGVTVNDIETAVDWYQDVLGFEHIMGPEKIRPNEGHFGDLIADGGVNYEWMKIAHLETGNHVGFELFEFDSTTDKSDSDNVHPGINHICVQDPQIEELADRITETGGKQVKDIWKIFPDKEYRMTYCEDPWGNFVEIHTHGYAAGHANIGNYY